MLHQSLKVNVSFFIVHIEELRKISKLWLTKYANKCNGMKFKLV